MKSTLDDMLLAGRNGDESAEKVEESYDADLRAIAGIFKAAEPGAVFSAPIVAGDYTVITASEISSAGGFGNTKGMAPAKPAPAEAVDETREEAHATHEKTLSANWSGGGGGGGSSARPIAVIVIGPDGVKVQPVVDATKFMLAFISMWRAVLPALFKVAIVRRKRKA